jgi:hypothetical protein
VTVSACRTGRGGQQARAPPRTSLRTRSMRPCLSPNEEWEIVPTIPRTPQGHTLGGCPAVFTTSGLKVVQGPHDRDALPVVRDRAGEIAAPAPAPAGRVWSSSRAGCRSPGGTALAYARVLVPHPCRQQPRRGAHGASEQQRAADRTLAGCRTDRGGRAATRTRRLGARETLHRPRGIDALDDAARSRTPLRERMALPPRVSAPRLHRCAA